MARSRVLLKESPAGVEFISNAARETKMFARRFARELSAGDVVLLEGQLGAGKTLFVKAVAAAFGYAGEVTSPSFTLMNIYRTPVVDLYHFDFYRIASLQEARDIGVEEYLGGSGICLLEWAGRFPALLPDAYYLVEILIPDFAGAPNRRRIKLKREAASNDRSWD